MTIKEVEKNNEVVFQIFDPTENIYSDLTSKFPVQSERCKN